MSKITFTRIYTSDYTDIGHQAGVKDGKQGKPQAYWGVLTQRHFINRWLWQVDSSYDSFADGYATGYQSGLKIRENIYHETPTQSQPSRGHTMSSADNYANILNGLETAKNGIERNIQQLQTYLPDYERQINAMKSIGFLDDYAQKLQTHNGLKIRIEGLENILRAITRKIAEVKTHVQDLKRKAEADQHA